MLSIEKFIRQNNLTLEQFAERVGCQRAHVSKLITGDRLPSLKLLRKIHEVTHIPYEILMRDCTGG